MQSKGIETCNCQNGHYIIINFYKKNECTSNMLCIALYTFLVYIQMVFVYENVYFPEITCKLHHMHCTCF